MAILSDPILLDNNVVSECVRVGAWKAFAARYTLETVETVEAEATTGYMHRAIIDPREFRRQVTVHPVTVSEQARVDLLAADEISLDPGERDLWAHALGRPDAWFLSCPDKASMRFGVRAGHRLRLVSLEQLLADIGFRPKIVLADQYRASWLDSKLSEYVLDELGGRR